MGILEPCLKFDTKNASQSPIRQNLAKARRLAPRHADLVHQVFKKFFLALLGAFSQCFVRTTHQ